MANIRLAKTVSVDKDENDTKHHEANPSQTMDSTHPVHQESADCMC